MVVDPRMFRDVMGCFATAVTVVSTLAKNKRPIGVTVNSFNSVSLDPPLVLYSLDKKATNLKSFSNADKVAINVLREDQEDISTGFATIGESFFDKVDYRISESGSPILSEALAIFHCTKETIHDGGDHIIFICRVISAHQDPLGHPLIYYRGRYSAISKFAT